MILHIDGLIQSSGLYREAFTHKSLNQNANFERLEFLGDSLIGALITEMLFIHYPKRSEGDLSRWKSTLIGQASLAEVCRELSLQNFLICNESEAVGLKSNERIQASLFEALLGALYLDKGHVELQKFVQKLFEDKIKHAAQSFEQSDSKTVFQEAAQKHLLQTPTYKTLESTGPSHDPHFKVAVCVGESIFATAEGSSLKLAHRKAAEIALQKLKDQFKTQNQKPSKNGDSA